MRKIKSVIYIYVTYSDNKLNRWVHVNHQVKKCNKCEFSTTSHFKLQKKNSPDDFFNILLSNKVWKETNKWKICYNTMRSNNLSRHMKDH